MIGLPYERRAFSMMCAERSTESNSVNPRLFSPATEDADILAAASEPLRISCLNEAARLTAGDRNKTYGEPVANMQHIADIFNAITGRDLTAREIAQVHLATKLARTQTSPTHRDSYVDAMAYRGIEFECALAAEAGEVDPDSL